MAGVEPRRQRGARPAGGGRLSSAGAAARGGSDTRFGVTVGQQPGWGSGGLFGVLFFSREHSFCFFRSPKSDIFCIASS